MLLGDVLFLDERHFSIIQTICFHQQKIGNIYKWESKRLACEIIYREAVCFTISNAFALFIFHVSRDNFHAFPTSDLWHLKAKGRDNCYPVDKRELMSFINESCRLPVLTPVHTYPLQVCIPSRQQTDFVLTSITKHITEYEKDRIKF